MILCPSIGLDVVIDRDVRFQDDFKISYLTQSGVIQEIDYQCARQTDQGYNIIPCEVLIAGEDKPRRFYNYELSVRNNSEE